MGMVGHPVGLECRLYGLTNEVARRHPFKGHRNGAILEAVEVTVKAVHPVLVHAHALPHGITALYGAIKYTDFRIVTVH